MIDYSNCKSFKRINIGAYFIENINYSPIYKVTKLDQLYFYAKIIGFNNNNNIKSYYGDNYEYQFIHDDFIYNNYYKLVTEDIKNYIDKILIFE